MASDQLSNRAVATRFASRWNARSFGRAAGTASRLPRHARPTMAIASRDLVHIVRPKNPTIRSQQQTAADRRNARSARRRLCPLEFISDVGERWLIAWRLRTDVDDADCLLRDNQRDGIRLGPSSASETPMMSAKQKRFTFFPCWVPQARTAHNGEATPSHVEAPNSPSQACRHARA
jgi:hypothetical protein